MKVCFVPLSFLTGSDSVETSNENTFMFSKTTRTHILKKYGGLKKWTHVCALALNPLENNFL